MKLRDLAPDLAALPTEALLARAPGSALFATLMPVADWYTERLPLWQVLGYYGAAVHPADRDVQLACLLPSHGTADTHKSARYYDSDRRTGERIGAVFCFKCQKQYTAFWYLYRQEMDTAPPSKGKRATLCGIYLALERLFGLPFPRDILLDHDDEAPLDLEPGAQSEASLAAGFREARALRAVKDDDPEAFVRALVGRFMLGV